MQSSKSIEEGFILLVYDLCTLCILEVLLTVAVNSISKRLTESLTLAKIQKQSQGETKKTHTRKLNPANFDPQHIISSSLVVFIMNSHKIPLLLYYTVLLTLNRPVIPIGNREHYREFFSDQYCYNLKNFPPL